MLLISFAHHAPLTVRNVTTEAAAPDAPPPLNPPCASVIINIFNINITASDNSNSFLLRNYISSFFDFCQLVLLFYEAAHILMI